MCGIAGLVSLHPVTNTQEKSLLNAVEKLSKRGPDASGISLLNNVALGHRRLSIIDTVESANQPLKDVSGRYSIVFNGEVFNYLEIKADLIKLGCNFETNSDTEVIINAYHIYGPKFLNKLNGFFAFAIYDKAEEFTFLARDRFGIKPLLYFNNDSSFYFASEMKALLEFPIERSLDQASLYTYLQLNYIPEPHSILENIKKLEPGHYLRVDKEKKVQKIPFYTIDYPKVDSSYSNISYQEAQSQFLELLDVSVQRRLVSDVPLGTFLSGGIDSSLITALATRHVPSLSTFSIGFKDDPHFDETEYALEVAKMYNTNHHVFALSRNDLLESLYDTLDYLDEPFADSSALAVNALCKRTKEHVTVALSGDGADELFGGYHKHRGEFLMRQNGIKQQLVKSFKPLWALLPKSRNSKFGNAARKLHKFANGASLSKEERYWLWASLMSEADATNFLIKGSGTSNYLKRKQELLTTIANGNDFNDVLFTDMKLVLKSDMLRKVDLMSMANSLEVRTPFLDHNLVDFAFTLNASYKIDANFKKKLVQDAARSLLPEKLYNRPKKGFEVPLHAWMTNELDDMISNDLLSDKFIKNQNLFNLNYVTNLKTKLKSPNPDDSQANVWAILVFNSWWKKYLS